MSIRRFFDQDVIISRMRTVSGDREAFSSTATVDGHIQELDRTATTKLGIAEERGWIAWFDVDADIKEGDELQDEAGKTYEVREITKKDYGANCHLQVILEEHNA